MYRVTALCSILTVTVPLSHLFSLLHDKIGGTPPGCAICAANKIAVKSIGPALSHIPGVYCKGVKNSMLMLLICF